MNVTKRRERAEAKHKKFMETLMAKDAKNRGVAPPEDSTAPVPASPDKEVTTEVTTEVEVSDLEFSEATVGVEQAEIGTMEVEEQTPEDDTAPIDENEEEVMTPEEIDAPILKPIKKKGGRKKKS